MSDDRDDRDDRRDRREARRDPEDLDERVAELESHVRELRDELGRPPEGPAGLPRPPTPREVLSFTGEYAIPTAIAVLEANVRALKALQRVVTALDPERSAVGQERDRLESRAADASRATLDRLESALEDVETTIRENDLPREEEARSILDDARRVNREIRDRVDSEREAADDARERARETDRERPRRDDGDRRVDDGGDRERRRAFEDSDDSLDGGTRIEVDDVDSEGRNAAAEDREGVDEPGPEVDVEAELRSIKDELDDARSTGATPTSESSDPDDESAADDASEEAATGERDDAPEDGADESDADDE
ncbi:DUF7547 family protein [Halorussus halobius]|uniref:DUF7547 family protein n=1 Tax=Halorussus halobius TaxID=1710537 RepID=UPI001092B59E|nr:hypothetical protein [Halorussus halobius]